LDVVQLRANTDGSNPAHGDATPKGIITNCAEVFALPVGGTRGRIALPSTLSSRLWGVPPARYFGSVALSRSTNVGSIV
jgi:hypothetical protein